MRRSAATPRRAAARACQHFLRSTSPPSSIIELGGNDALRGGKLATTRDNLDAMVVAAQAAGAQGAGRRHGDPAELRACVRARVPRPVSRACRARARCRSCRRSSRGSARTSRSSSPTASIRPRRRRSSLLDNVWPQLVPLLQAVSASHHRAKVGIAALREHAERIDVRSPSEFAIDHIPGAVNLPVLDDRERARGRHDPREGIGDSRPSGTARRSSRATSRASSRRTAATSRANGRRSCIAGAAASAADRSRTS